MGEYADDSWDSEDRWSWTPRERHWTDIVRYCRKHTPYSYKSRNERTFHKYVNRPVDYKEF